MKRKLITATLCMAAFSVGAQNAYDVVDLATKELNGTARFVGMGGAMGALGGDISTISTNPAGIALFRRGDIMVTAGFDDQHIKLGGESQNNTRARLNNAGIVVPVQINGGGLLKHVNLAFNYQRRTNFYKNMSTGMLLNGASQMNQMTYQAEGVSPSTLSTLFYNSFNNGSIGWLSIMGYNGYVIDQVSEGSYQPFRELYQGAFNRTERGGIDQSDLNISFNINDRFYIGATVGFYDVDYKRFTDYTEADASGQFGYTLYSDNWITGDGVDFKLGVIARPFEASTFRIGAAVHTPIFYRLTLGTGAELFSRDFDESGTIYEDYISSYEYLDGAGVMEQDFKLRTPWVFNLNAGYTIGRNIALGAEYEYEDFSTSNLKDYDGVEAQFENAQIKSVLKGMHTLRLGAEYKVIPELALRVGYNYSSAAYEKGSNKELKYNSISTDTDYTNKQAQHVLTAGLGVRITRDVYLDMAYKYIGQKGDFYAFNDDLVAISAIKRSDKTHSFMATLGYRF